MRAWPALILCVVLAACGRNSESRGESPSSPRNGTLKVDPNGPADPGYVTRLVAATAFDYGQCNRTARLSGVDGRTEAGSGAVVIAVDSSGSMAARSPGGGTRMAEAARAVGSFASRLPAGTRVGLVAFGQAGSNREADKEASCSAPAATLLPITAGAAGIAEAAARLRPTGWTPLATAITAAAAQAGAQGVVYVVSDGIETCGGEPVAAARQAKSASVVINVVGFGIADRGEEAALRAVAAAGGGRYLAVAAGALDEALRMEASRAITANSVNTGQAMQSDLTCYYDHMRAQADTTGRRINADQIAGRISSKTAAAAFKQQDARYARASNDLATNHTGLAARREEANVNAVDAISGPR